MPAATVCLALAAGAVPGFGHGGFEERHQELTAALAREPDNGALHYQLAEVYCLDGHVDWGRALAALEAADKLGPTPHAVDLLRGKVLLAGGRPADALAAYGDRDAAVQLLAEAVQTLGAVPSLVLQALELELATGRFDDALARVDTLRKIWPLPEPWHARRAAILAQAGRLDEARAEWGALLAHIESLPPTRRASDAVQSVEAEARAALASAAFATPKLSQLRPRTRTPTK